MTLLARIETASADLDEARSIPALAPSFVKSIYTPLEDDLEHLEWYRSNLRHVVALANMMSAEILPLPKIAERASHPIAFGFAHCLAHLKRNGFLGRDVTIGQVVDMVYSEDLRRYQRDRDGTQLTFKRYHLLNRLADLGLIEKDAPPRSLRPAGSTPPLRALISLVCANHQNITEQCIRSNVRTRPVVRARFDLIWIMRHVCGHSLTSIGQQIGRDHSTVLSALNSLIVSRTSNVGRSNAIEKMCEKADDLGIVLHHEMQMRQL